MQATVARGPDRLLAEWVHDSAYRFFPLVEDDELGLTLHPFDLATNKVLALIGRLEVRDWIDVIARAGRRTTRRTKSECWHSRDRRQTPLICRGGGVALSTPQYP